MSNIPQINHLARDLKPKNILYYYTKPQIGYRYVKLLVKKFPPNYKIWSSLMVVIPSYQTMKYHISKDHTVYLLTT